MYPLDGNRFAVGTDTAHLGGDVWTADAGMAMMENEDWSGMLLTLGSIDKMSHMWGGRTDTGTYTGDAEQAHLRFIAKTADEQVGLIIQKLRDLDLLDETLVVLTTDHAGQPAIHFNGVNAAGRSDNNWYYGATPTRARFLSPSPSLAAADRHRQRALQLPGLGDPHVADRHLDAGEDERRQGDGDAAGRDRVLPQPERPPLPARAGEPGGDEPVRARRGGTRTARRSSTRWRRRGRRRRRAAARRHELRRRRRPRWRPEARPGDPDRLLRRGGRARSDPKTPAASVDILPTVLRAMGLQRGATPRRAGGGATAAELAELDDLGRRLAGAQALEERVGALAEEDDVAQLDLLVAADQVGQLEQLERGRVGVRREQ